MAGAGWRGGGVLCRKRDVLQGRVLGYLRYRAAADQEAPSFCSAAVSDFAVKSQPFLMT